MDPSARLSRRSRCRLVPRVRFQGAPRVGFHTYSRVVDIRLVPLQAYILTGDESYHDVFQSFYGAVMSFVRDETGFWVRSFCLPLISFETVSLTLILPYHCVLQYRGAALETGERIGVTVE